MGSSLRRFASLATALALIAGPIGGASAAALVHAPRLPVPGGQGHAIPATALGWSSSNWSGYAISGGPYTSISGTWTVPAVQSSARATYSSSWIGIDGFTNSNLIQTGTEQDYYGGSAHYGAWWEILPAAETVIPTLTINPGDHMSSTITKLSGSSWSITLTDSTSGHTFQTTRNYTGSGTSAEWIQEAPEVGGSVAKLANYGATAFLSGTVDAGNPNLMATDGGVMVQKSLQVSTPSVPDTSKSSFAVAYGSSQPAPPNGPTPDFSIGATPPSQTVVRGSSTSYSVSITPINGFSGTVTLGVTGLPSGATPTFAPPTTTTSSTLSIATTGAVTPGSYPLTITGTSGGLVHQTSVTLVVTVGGPVPDAPVLSAKTPARGNPGVKLMWTRPAANGSAITGYRVYRGTSPGSETFLTALPVSPVNWIDASATSTHTFYYTITAVNANGESAASNEVSAVAR